MRGQPEPVPKKGKAGRTVLPFRQGRYRTDRRKPRRDGRGGGRYFRGRRRGRRLGRCRLAGRLSQIALHPVECGCQRVPKGLPRQGVGPRRGGYPRRCRHRQGPGPCRGRSRKHLHDDSREIGLGDRRPVGVGGRQHPGEHRCLGGIRRKKRCKENRHENGCFFHHRPRPSLRGFRRSVRDLPCRKRRTVLPAFPFFGTGSG